jgi:hypothetical protein
MSADVPIADAMLCWNSGLHGETPGCIVVRHPDYNDASEDYSSSVGACFADWRGRDTRGQQLQLIIEAWHIAAFYAVPIEQVHQALLVIPEYRSMLADDCLPRQFISERQ